MTQDITNTIQQFFTAVDMQDWDRARGLMTMPFFLDYSSFGAPAGADMAPDQILTSWQGILPGFDATHHQLGLLDIEAGASMALVRAYVTATHYMASAQGGDLWTVYGTYTLQLRYEEGWKLRGNTFSFKFLSGNVDLPNLAKERMARDTAAQPA